MCAAWGICIALLRATEDIWVDHPSRRAAVKTEGQLPGTEGTKNRVAFRGTSRKLWSVYRKHPTLDGKSSFSLRHGYDWGIHPMFKQTHFILFQPFGVPVPEMNGNDPTPWSLGQTQQPKPDGIIVLPIKYANLNKPKYHIISKLVPIGYVRIWFYRNCCPINIINAGQVPLWQSNMVCRKTTHLVGWFSRLTAHSVPGFPSLFDYQEGKPSCCSYTIIPHYIPGISQNILYPRYIPIISHYTSSTAQNGGASFKDRKPIQDSQFSTLLTCKCASHHNQVHFFDIWTSKSGPRPPVSSAFHFDMCFAPHWRALFEHLNFQKCSEPEVLLTFWLGNLLGAAAACTFSSLISPNGSACTRRFSEPTLRPSGATKHWTKHISATCLPVRAIWSSSFWLFLFSFFFSSLVFSFFSCLLFSSLTLPTSAASSVNIVGSLTSKLLSVNHISWPNCMILPIRDPHTLVMSPTCWPLGQVTTHGIRPDLAAQHVLEQLQNLQLWQLWPFADLWGGNGRYPFLYSFMIFYGSFSYNDIHNANV